MSAMLCDPQMVGDKRSAKENLEQAIASGRLNDEQPKALTTEASEAELR